MDPSSRKRPREDDFADDSFRLTHESAPDFVAAMKAAQSPSAIHSLVGAIDRADGKAKRALASSGGLRAIAKWFSVLKQELDSSSSSKEQVEAVTRDTVQVSPAREAAKRAPARPRSRRQLPRCLLPTRPRWRSPGWWSRLQRSWSLEPASAPLASRRPRRCSGNGQPSCQRPLRVSVPRAAAAAARRHVAPQTPAR